MDLAKEVLSRLVADVWDREARLRSVWRPDPIAVQWKLTSRAGIMDHPRLVANGPVRFSGSSAKIEELAVQFRELRRRRLVILGRSGGGKTTLALQLALELAESRGPKDPVPVIFPLSGWDAGGVLKFRHDGAVRAVAFSPDGTLLATGCEDKRARVWDAASGERLLEVRHDRAVWAVAFSPDGTRLATGSLDRSVQIWPLAADSVI